MKRFIVSVVNANGNAELGFSNMWMDGDDPKAISEFALDTVSEATGITRDRLVVAISEKY